MKKILSCLFLVSILQSLSVQAQLYFEDKEQINQQINIQMSGSQILDFDNDNLDDIIYNQSGRLYFRKNLGGNNGFADPQFLCNLPSLCYIIIDWDNDGDKDILLYNKYYSLAIYLIENDSENDEFLDLVQLSHLPSSPPCSINSFVLNDYDSDGDIDIYLDYFDYGEYRNECLYYENTGNSSITSQVLQTPQMSFNYIGSVDIDNDSDIDIVTYNPVSMDCYVFRNDGSGFNEPSLYYNLPFEDTDLSVKIDIVDLNSDNLYEFVVSDYEWSSVIVLSYNSDQDAFVKDTLIKYVSPGIDAEFYYVDYDYDGDIDCVEKDSFSDFLHWAENVDNQYPFTRHSEYDFQIPISSSIYFANFNDDNIRDIYFVRHEKLLSCLFSSPTDYFETRFDLEQYEINDVKFIDITGNGKNEMIVSSNVGINLRTYYLNDSDRYESYTNMVDTLYRFNSFELVDIDNDGDKDILGSCFYYPLIWFENEEGEFDQSYEFQINYDKYTLPDKNYLLDDIDGDGDIDIYSLDIYKNEMCWFKNRINEGSSFQRKSIDEDYKDLNEFILYDKDGDGDNDLVKHDVWFENTDSEPRFVKHISNNFKHYDKIIEIGDVNNDGIDDFIVENTANYLIIANPGTSLTENRIYLGEVSDMGSVKYIKDFDNDGFNEALSINNSKDLFLVELDPENIVINPLIADIDDNSTDYFICDTDDDGDIDIFSLNYLNQLFFYEDINIGFVSNPSDTLVCPTEIETDFIVEANDATSYQWQSKIDGIFTDISDNDSFQGTNTNHLQIQINQNNKYQSEFRCLVSNEHYSKASNIALLNVMDDLPPIVLVSFSDTVMSVDQECGIAMPTLLSSEYVMDNCNNSFTIEQYPLAESVLSSGNYDAFISVNDGYGNVTKQEFKLEITDVESPEIEVPMFVEMAANRKSGLLITSDLLNPTYIHDNCEIKTIYNDVTHTDSLINHEFEVGVHVFNWVVEDVNNNRDTAQVVLNVTDFNNLNTLDMLGVQVYPNPVENMLQIESIVHDIDRFKVIDMYGNIFINQKIPIGFQSIDLSMLNSGVYYIEIDIKGESFIQKIVKI